MLETRPVQERRRAVRLPLTVRVQMFVGSEELQGYSTDISATGIYVETARPVPVGSNLRLGFTVGGTELQRVQIEGRVVQALAPASARGAVPGMGIVFERFVRGKAELVDDLRRRFEAFTAPRPELPAEEQRAPRLLVGFPVLWSTKPPPRRDGFMINLSSTGAYVFTEKPEAPGAEIHLWFDVPAQGQPQRVRAIAEVMRRNLPADGASSPEPSGMGISFVPASRADIGLIHFIGEQLQRRRSAGQGEGDASAAEGRGAGSHDDRPTPPVGTVLSRDETAGFRVVQVDTREPESGFWKTYWDLDNALAEEKASAAEALEHYKWSDIEHILDQIPDDEAEVLPPAATEPVRLDSEALHPAQEAEPETDGDAPEPAEDEGSRLGPTLFAVVILLVALACFVYVLLSTGG